MISHDSRIASYCRLWCSQTYSSSHILRVQTTSISGTCRTSRMRMAMSTVCAVAFGAVQDMRPDSDGHLKHSTCGQETWKQTKQNCRYLAFHFLHSLHDIFSTFFFFSFSGSLDGKVSLDVWFGRSVCRLSLEASARANQAPFFATMVLLQQKSLQSTQSEINLF